MEMNYIFRDALSDIEFNRMLDIYNAALSCEKLNISAPTNDPEDCYLLVYDAQRLCAYAQISDYESHIWVSAVVSPDYRQLRIFTQMSLKLDEMFNDREILYFSDEFSPSAKHLLAEKFEIVSTEFLMTRDIDCELPVGDYLLTKADEKEYAKIYRKIFFPRLSLKIIKELLASMTGEYHFIFRFGKRVLGIASISEQDGLAGLSSVGILKKYRGMGHSTYLINSVVNRLYADGCLSVSVHVDADNEPAVRLYKKSGFTEKSRLNMCIKKNIS